MIHNTGYSKMLGKYTALAIVYKTSQYEMTNL